MGDGDGPRRGPGSASTSPAGPADLDGAAQAGTGLRRGPAAHGAGPGRGEIAVDGPSRSWPPGPALTAGFAAGLAVESHRPAHSRPGSSGMDSLRRLPHCPPLAARTRWRIFRAPVRSTCAPLPGLRPPTARRAPGRRHQAPARVVPAPARDRADPAPASAPCPSSDAFAHLPGALPSDLGPGPHRATRFPCPPRPRGFRGQSHVRRRAPFAGIPDESRRTVDTGGPREP